MKNWIQHPTLKKNNFWHPFFQFVDDFGVPLGFLKSSQGQQKPQKSLASVWGKPSQRVLCDFSCFFGASGRPKASFSTILAPFWPNFVYFWYDFCLVFSCYFQFVFLLNASPFKIWTAFLHTFHMDLARTSINFH